MATIDLDAVIDEIDKNDASDLGLEDMGDFFMMDDLEESFGSGSSGGRGRTGFDSGRSGRSRASEESDYQTYNFDER